jgi:putative tryptophan/tyrosine transport system substrate-binding protein
MSCSEPFWGNNETARVYRVARGSRVELRRCVCRAEIADGRIGLLSTAPRPPIECCADPECKSPHRDAYQNPKCVAGALAPYGWLLADLHALGWHEGDNLNFEGRSNTLGDPASLPRLAAELVALRPDVLIATGSDEAKALQAATRDIPIVFISSSDPVGYGLVDSIAHPGRNITGIAVAPQILWGKRLELLVDLLGHRPAKIAWLSNPEAASHKPNLVALMQSADRMGIKVERLEVRGPSDFDRVFAATAGSEALLVQWLNITAAHGRQIAELAVQYLLPSVYEVREYVVDGGLMSYGLDYRENWRRGANYVDRILRGAQPKDMPVEQASTFKLVINLKTANALGLTVPPMLLARVDEVIE